MRQYSSGSGVAHMCQIIRRGAARVPIRSRYERVFSILVYSKREFPILLGRGAYASIFVEEQRDAYASIFSDYKLF
jgi:hypothetical protein